MGGIRNEQNQATVLARYEMKDCSYACGEENKIVQIGLVLQCSTRGVLLRGTQPDIAM